MKINYQKLSIIELHKLLASKVITSEQLTKMAFERLKQFDNLNAVVSKLEVKAINLAKNNNNIPIAENNYLFGIPFVTKDNIATIGDKTTGSSKILVNFITEYDSTVNSLLTKSNAINIAKTALDELGMGGEGLYAATGYVYNPWNLECITGGSSSGSAALVAAGVVPFSLGTDTGDSIRKPAAYCGIIGYKPTYGLISRNGIFPYAPSLDTVGFFTNYVCDVALLLDVLVQQDHKDFTNFKSIENNYYKNLNSDVKGKKIAILNYKYYKWSDKIKQKFDQAISSLVQNKAEISYVDFPTDLLNSLLPIYMIISFAEATSCHSNLNGINFGERKEGKTYQETMIKTRTAGFGNIVKRRYVIGSYVLSANHQEELFVKAKKIRRIVVNKLTELFQKFDAFIVMPSVETAPKIKDILTKNKIIHSEHKFMEDLLLLANLAGCPSITIPLTLLNNMPIGININSAPFKDQTALNIAAFLSEKINFKNSLLGDDNE